MNNSEIILSSRPPGPLEVKQEPKSITGYFKKTVGKVKREPKNFIWEFFTSLFPILVWLPNYSWKKDLLYDLTAGLTVGSMIVPQSLSYASLAGLPLQYGLYSAFVPPIIYALMGTSREINVGPVSMVSLIVASTLTTYFTPESTEYINYAIFLALLSGALLFLVGILRLGFIIENLLSVPILSGFTQGVAILIIGSQLGNFFQIAIPKNSNTIIDYIRGLVDFADNTYYPAVLMGLGAIIIIISVKYIPVIGNRTPTPLIVLIAATLITFLARLDKDGMVIVGKIPKGLVSPPTFKVSWHVTEKILPSVFIIGLVGFMEAISVAKRFESMRFAKKYTKDPEVEQKDKDKNKDRNEENDNSHLRTNQELIALGAANLFGSLFRSYPVSGSLSRTAVNYSCHTKTPLHNFFVGVIVLFVLLFATTLFKYTPKCILSAIVMAAALSLVDFTLKEPRFLFKSGEYFDFIELVLTFLVTLLLGPEWGVGIAVGLTMIQVIYHSSRPHVASLGRINLLTSSERSRSSPDCEIYRDLTRFPTAETIPGVLIVRPDACLAFYNITRFKSSLRKLEKTVPQLHSVIIDCSGITSIDSTAIRTIEELLNNYRIRDITCVWVNARGSIRDQFESLEHNNMVSMGRIIMALSISDALNYIQKTLRTVELTVLN